MKQFLLATLMLLGVFAMVHITLPILSPQMNLISSQTLQVNGNKIVDMRGDPVFLKGVDFSGEYQCPPTATYSDSRVDLAEGWHSNAIKLTVNPAFWLSGYGSCTANQYQMFIKNTVAYARSKGLYVIVAAYQWAKTPADGMNMATSTTLAFWQSAAHVWALDTGVLYETFNEPHNISASIWLNGGSGYVGEQQLADTIRHTGASNILIIDGTNWGGEIGNLLPNYALKGSNIAYAEHLWTNGNNLNPANWPANWENVAKIYPIVVTEFGDNSSNCAYTNWLQQVMPAIVRYADGMFAWAFNSDGTVCGRPDLIMEIGAVSAYGQPIYAFYTVTAPMPTPTPISATCTTTNTYNNTTETLTITTVCTKLP